MIPILLQHSTKNLISLLYSLKRSSIFLFCSSVGLSFTGITLLSFTDSHLVSTNRTGSIVLGPTSVVPFMTTMVTSESHVGRWVGRD